MNDTTKVVVSTIESPPTTVLGIISRLGPGMIIAGSIVGSGELIATTSTGSQSGYWLLWLILVGCVIKVFVQVEFGRFSICTGLTTMEGMNEVPGPRFPFPGSKSKSGGNVRVSWIIWYWVLMFAASTGQLGGIVGLVGQSLSMSFPITRLGSLEDQYGQADVQLKIVAARLRTLPASEQGGKEEGELKSTEQKWKTVEARLAQELLAYGPLRKEKKENQTQGDRIIRARDDIYWALAITIVTSVLLVLGRYWLIQTVTTWLVAGFTVVTVLAVLALQWLPEFSMTSQDLIHGLSFRLPPSPEYDSQKALSNALSTFGIIGVGAAELIAYPYWCLEHGYARYAGANDHSPSWLNRALGWLKVMRWDAWCSMLVYTIATAAFYILGAATLGKFKLDVQGADIVRTLMAMYEPVFGFLAGPIFLLGAFAVLFSTFFVASAGNARIVSDAMAVVGVASREEKASRARVVFLSGLFPILSFLIFICFKSPKDLIMLSGLMQAMMLPMLAFAGLYFRWKRCEAEVAPGRLWDLFLIVSSLGMLASGACAAYVELAKFYK